jgi:hypothetical protein
VSRQRWSNKKKAQVLTVGTMVFLMTLIVLLPRAMAYDDPKHCYGYADCYSIGYSRGSTNAYSDYWNNIAYNSGCPYGHSYAYCNGYGVGYSHEWMIQYHVHHGSSSSGNGYQPRCVSFCGIIKVG